MDIIVASECNILKIYQGNPKVVSTVLAGLGPMIHTGFKDAWLVDHPELALTGGKGFGSSNPNLLGLDSFIFILSTPTWWEGFG